jgi:hypothetical protein
MCARHTLFNNKSLIILAGCAIYIGQTWVKKRPHNGKPLAIAVDTLDGCLDRLFGPELERLLAVAEHTLPLDTYSGIVDTDEEVNETYIFVALASLPPPVDGPGPTPERF